MLILRLLKLVMHLKTILALGLCLICLGIFGGCSEDEPIIDEPAVDSDNSPPSEPNPLEGTDFNVLFIGNSLTYVNDLPGLVREVATTHGFSIGTRSLAYSNYGLQDHWRDGELQAQIQTGHFDFVVVQQGPSSQALGREVLIEYGARIKELCDKNDVQLAFFMVWPSLAYYNTFDGVIKNYTDAARINESILCPVGQVWKTHFDQTFDHSYYGSDGFHPSLKGSEVAAEVIFRWLPK